jgi:AcrR family transcriptional regulator
VSHGRPAEGRLRLLAAAEHVFATHGLEVPNREIIAVAGQHNRSAVTYHFASRDGLVDAVCERHEIPVAQHRRHLIARLPGPGDRATRQLVEAHLQPLTAEMLRCAPSYWARLSELLLADQPLRLSRAAAPGAAGQPGPRRPADAGLTALLDLMAAHLSHLPAPEAADRVALTVRFMTGGLARWERDHQDDPGRVAPLPSFALMLSDLAVAMLDAPSSAPPAAGGYPGPPHLATRPA